MKILWAVGLVVALAGCSGEGVDSSKSAEKVTEDAKKESDKTSETKTPSDGDASSSAENGEKSPELKEAFEAAPAERSPWQKTLIRQECLKEKGFPMIADKKKPTSLQIKDFTGTTPPEFPAAWSDCTKMHDLNAGGAAKEAPKEAPKPTEETTKPADE